MNFKQRNYILNLIHHQQHNVYMSSDSDERTEKLAEIKDILKEFKDLTKDSLDETPQLVPHDDYGDLFTAEEWMSEGMRGMSFIPSDGSGYWATKDGHSYDHYDIFGHKPSWATHVAWYNQ